MARRLMRPLRIGSALGWSLAAVTVAAALLGLAFGWAEMLAVALLGALLILAAVPFVLRTATYRVTVELAASRVTVGDAATGRVLVANAATRPAPPTRVMLPVGAARPEFDVPRLPVGEEHDELFLIPTQRRAVLTLGPVTSVRSDPLELLHRRVRWTEPTELYVHPRVLPLDGDTAGLLRDLEGLPTRDLADDDVSFHALREYVPGDDLRHVHWRSTARIGSLMIRQFEQTRRSHLVVALSTRAQEYADEEELELAVSIAGSVGLAAVRDGKDVSLVAGEAVHALRSGTHLLDTLSAVAQTPADRGVAEMGRTVAAAVPGASVVLLVTGALAAPAEVRSASVRVPVTARTLCLRAARGEDLSRRMLGELPMVSLPELPALRLAMRAVTA